MRITNKTKLFGAIAVAGIVAAGGSAFTGTGVATSGTAKDPQFVGGTVSQSVTGATLSEIRYGFTDATNTSANSAQLTFDVNAAGKPVGVVLNPEATSVTGTCGNVAAETPYTSLCTFSGTSVNSIAVTVGGSTTTPLPSPMP